MKKVIVFLLTICAMNALAQSAQQEINEQVWIPFIKSFSEIDTKTFMALHSKDAVRSPRNAKVVWNWNEYYERMQQDEQRKRSSAEKRQLELRFTERIANKDLAVEVGIYKTTYIAPDGSTRSSLGRFHVVLRKENAVWKILVDMDSSEGGTITEKDLLAAAPLQ